MLKLHKHFTLLTFLLLVIGLQTTKSYGAVYASYVNAELTSSNVELSAEYLKADAKEQDTQAVELFAEIAELNKEEEETAVVTVENNAISHTYFSSFLRFTILDIYVSEKRFETPKIKASNHLYIQFQVFRL